MSARAFADRPALTIRGARYPLLLPTVRDPRLHLAAVIVSLQVLGQTAFDFDLSIAQILVAVGTCGVLEVGIAFFRQRVLMWPASALLTGNGVAFILRVPGTEHGDWWSLHGWWIFVAAAAIGLLSKYVLTFRGRHVFNPSNFGLVPIFLLLGSERADPLAFWWGPVSPALVVALVLIVCGGLAILGRLHLTEIAIVFWLSFAAGIGLLAAGGHAMTAAWHVGPIEGVDFWWTLVSSPEILVFLFFMITDPRTIPTSAAGRRVYAVGIGLLATLLSAPFTTEFATKVAVLGALFLACAARPVLVLLGERRLGSCVTRFVSLRASRQPRRVATAAFVVSGAVVFAGVVLAAGLPARPEAASATPAAGARVPEITVVAAEGVAGIGRRSAREIAGDIVGDLRDEAEALRRQDRKLATAAATGEWLATLWDHMGAAEQSAAPVYSLQSVRLTVRRATGQGPPRITAALRGTVDVADVGKPISGRWPLPFRRTVELVHQGGRYRISRSRGGVSLAPSPSPALASGRLGGISFDDVAAEVGLDFRHGAFRFGVSSDETAMMGGGLCWLDYDDDGWLDLFVVNSYADTDLLAYEERGGLPRSALFHNLGGRFEDVSRRSGVDLPLRGDGCVAADFNLDGRTDLYVTTAGFNVPTEGYDALLWNDGDGTFTEGAREAGINAPGWHAGAAVGDVNGDGRPDLFVAAYTDVNAMTDSPAGFPTNHLAVRDLLYLNDGTDESGHSTFREVARGAGVERTKVGHGLGAVFTDVNRDGRLDLYVANDADPNQLYLNVPDRSALGFRLEEIARRAAVDDPNAGMGIAAGDFTRDGWLDLLVTNARGELHAVYRRRSSPRPAFADARPDVAVALGTRSTGWGASWLDLDLDADLDLVVANGAIPVVDLRRNAEEVQVVLNRAGRAGDGSFSLVSGASVPHARVNGRGLAAADFDNDGDLDVAVNSIGGRLMLLRNAGGSRRGHWLEVRFRDFVPGAEVAAVLPDGRRLVREVLAGSSYLSSEDPRLHFGLGSATRVKELRIRFPDGRRTRLTDVAADRAVAVGWPR